MFAILKIHKHLFISLIILLIIGTLPSIIAIVFSTTVLFFFISRNKLNDLLLFFIFILILSDNFSYPFAVTVKPIFLIVLFGFLLVRKIPLGYDFFKGFIPFFIIAVLCLINSFSFFTSIQKEVSYALLFLTIPPLVVRCMCRNAQDRIDFIKLLVVFYVFIIALGLILYVSGIGIVRIVKGGRISGLFGNPNGLGIFSFLTTMLISTIFYLHPNLFSKKWEIVSYVIIAIALFLSGSRGGILSSLAFISILFWIQKRYSYIFICLIGLVFFFLKPEPEQQDELGELNEYMRLDQENVTSGRDIAWQLALEEINNGNYWLSKGMGYSEYYMLSIFEEASDLGHQGNVHNSYLTIWLDTGLIGLITFIFGWLACFWKAYVKQPLTLAIFCGILFSTNVESWLAASLNPYTITLIIMLVILINFKPEIQKEVL